MKIRKSFGNTYTSYYFDKQAVMIFNDGTIVLSFMVGSTESAAVRINRKDASNVLTAMRKEAKKAK